MGKIKILFIIPNLAGGGSERMVTNLCNNLNRNKFDIYLCLLKAEGEYITNIKDDVRIIDLNILHVRNSIYKIINLIKREKPQVVMSTLTHLNIYLSLFLPFFSHKIKFIARESNILSLILEKEHFIVRFLSRYISRFNKIIAQSLDMKEDLVSNFSINPQTISVINNFVDVDYVEKKLDEYLEINLPSCKINLLAIGRFEYQKGFDLLLKSFSLLKERSKYHLTILGSGSLDADLKNMVKGLDMEDNITFVGFCSNPYKYMDKADVLISSSRFEGFPNVVLEALCCGLPVIANNYKGGINEILSNSNFGSIINIAEAEELSRALSRISSLDRNSIKKEARANYSKEKILSLYEQIFFSIIL